MKELENTLRESLEGDVYFEDLTRSIYSVDASIFEVTPIGVVAPKSKEDILQIVKIASQFKVPLTARGAATGIAGGALGRGLVVDFSRYLNQIVLTDIENRFVEVEPGVIQDALNQHLCSFGFRLGPDTSTGNRATLGGMLANNAAGARSLKYGAMKDHIQQVELVLATGQIVILCPMTISEWNLERQLDNEKGHILQALWEIRNDYRSAIEKHIPSISRISSGYNLKELLQPELFNPAALIAGSEGTLGFVSKMRLKIVEKTGPTALLLFYYDNLAGALDDVSSLLTFKPIALELIDKKIMELGLTSPSFGGTLAWLKPPPEALLIFEIESDNIENAQDKIESIRKSYLKNCPERHCVSLVDPAQIQQVWNLRKAGLGLLLSKRTYSRAIAFLEDLSIHPNHLSDFMSRFLNYLSKNDLQAGIYGHVGAGCMHIRPYLNLQETGQVSFMRQMMVEIADLVLEYDGALSGEHGDGLIRSWLNPKMFGNELMEAFVKLKSAFDPLHLMNPGKIIPVSQELEDLRARPGTAMIQPETFLDFSKEGGFALSADLCNGNGQCRKPETVMCPSFQATNDERHSTRARAQALRAIIHQRLPSEELTGHQMHDVMDLCLSCKGCKRECPSQVDMAKFKSEFLFQYQEKHGYSLRSKFFASVGALANFFYYFRYFHNRIVQNKWIKKSLEWAGISPKTPLPLYASIKFSEAFLNITQQGAFDKHVFLMNDTFTEFYHPEIGIKATELLNALGYRVYLLPWKCCGRPALSKGFLKQAKDQARTFVDSTLSFLKSTSLPGGHVIGLEPSCILTILDDYESLLGSGDNNFKQLKDKSLSIDQFLALHFNKFGVPPIFSSKEQHIQLHGHCYQKAVTTMKPTVSVLEAIDGFHCSEIPSGCCGMAGSFGYEKEHEALSMKIAELKLLPAIRKIPATTWVIASGTSCRQQILKGTGKKALHIIEALWQQMH